MAIVKKERDLAERIILGILLGGIAGIWVLLFVWAQDEAAKGLLVIMTIFGATRFACKSCADDGGHDVE